MEDGTLGPSGDRTGSLIDQHVGERLRDRRVAAGLSIDTVAQALGVCAGDIVSWEEGDRRIPARYLLATSDLLSCPLTVFFEGFLTVAQFDEDIDKSEHDVSRLFTHYSDVKH